MFQKCFMQLSELNLSGKRVLMRVDFNVPLDAQQQITDDTRMRAALPSIRHILDAGASLVLMSHLGRPQKKLLEDGAVDKKRFSLQPLVSHLGELTGASVDFAADCVGAEAEEKAKALAAGSILLLENTRFHKEEKKGDAAFAEKLARLADVYVNDAFGTAHRAHASTTTVAQYFEAGTKAFGLLLQRELEQADRLLSSTEKPFTAIVGGAKVSDKILLLERLLDEVEQLLIGGGMAYTFIKAQGGQIANSLVEEEKLDLARSLLAKAEEKGVALLLPEDSVAADAFSNAANKEVVASAAIPEGWMGLDIGPKARTAFAEAIERSKRILWNGPMGVFEMPHFAEGTMAMANAVAKATDKGAFSLVGGGDSVSAVNKSGVAERISFISTGGGAMLELLEGKVLPGVEAMG